MQDDHRLILQVINLLLHLCKQSRVSFRLWAQLLYMVNVHYYCGYGRRPEPLLTKPQYSQTLRGAVGLIECLRPSRALETTVF